MTFLLAAFQDAPSHLVRLDAGHNAVHPHHNAVQAVGEDGVTKVLIFDGPQGVALPSHGVEVDAIFRQGGGEHLPVGCQDVAPCSGQHLIVAFILRTHRQPIVMLDKHDIGRLTEDDKSGYGTKHHDCDVAWNDVFGRKCRFSFLHVLQKRMRLSEWWRFAGACRPWISAGR